MQEIREKIGIVGEMRYNMKIKTYPLQFTEEYLKHIEEVAKKQGKTIKNFILEAIKEKIEKLEKGE